MLTLFAITLLASTYITNFEVVPYFRQYNMQYYKNMSIQRPYLEKHRVVLYVNIGLHHPFYENITYIEDPYYIRALVNKHHKLPSYFSPYDLVSITQGQYMRKRAADSFLKMKEEMAANNMLLIIRSTYRSYNTQAYIFSRNVNNMGQAWADKWSARPGHSEHQLGLAIDFLHYGSLGASLSEAAFENTKHYDWLLSNAHRFGFILRYPKRYTHITGYEFEPWHWRYIGVKTATYMYKNSIPTLEHYFATRYYSLPYQAISVYYLVQEIPQVSVYDIQTLPPAEGAVITFNPIIVAVFSTIVVILFLGFIIIIAGERRKRKIRKKRQSRPRGTIATYRK